MPVGPVAPTTAISSWAAEKEALALVQEDGDRPPRKQGDRRLPMRHVLGGRPLSALREVMRPAVKQTDSRSDYGKRISLMVLLPWDKGHRACRFAGRYGNGWETSVANPQLSC